MCADHARATRGRIAEPAAPQVLHAGGWPVWDLGAFQFVDEEPPPEVNPSLWRQARLNNEAGLFEVAPGFHQVRGLDLSNLTVIEGTEGRVLIDPLTSAQTARAAPASPGRWSAASPTAAKMRSRRRARTSWSIWSFDPKRWTSVVGDTSRAAAMGRPAVRVRRTPVP